MDTISTISAQLQKGNRKALARAITLVENQSGDYWQMLESLPGKKQTQIIGITGPPGAGKSTLVDALLAEIVAEGKKAAVLCVDPSSPFHRGALLGDRIRMSEWYNHPDIFIRSLSSRGSLGGLHPHIIEVQDLLQAAGFDYILIETVGVGQSEVEIAMLADCSIVVLVPEAGDDVQVMKAGLMEIADLFVVNKSDRPDAQRFVKYLREAQQGSSHRKKPAPVIPVTAHKREGIAELWKSIQQELQQKESMAARSALLAEKAWQLLLQQRMQGIDKAALQKTIEEAIASGTFNLYKLVNSLKLIVKSDRI